MNVTKGNVNAKYRYYRFATIVEKDDPSEAPGRAISLTASLQKNRNLSGYSPTRFYVWGNNRFTFSARVCGQLRIFYAVTYINGREHGFDAFF